MPPPSAEVIRQIIHDEYKKPVGERDMANILAWKYALKMIHGEDFEESDGA